MREQRNKANKMALGLTTAEFENFFANLVENTKHKQNMDQRPRVAEGVLRAPQSYSFC